MKISFQKIPFDSVIKREIILENESDSLKTNFELSIKERNLAFCKINMNGKININCNTCGVDLKKNIDEEIEILIKNGIYDGFNEEFDVVEVPDGTIDLNEIINSELELLRDEIEHCEKCSKTEDNFIFEI